MALPHAALDYDADFRREPMRDLKAFTGHFSPDGLAFVIAKNAAISGLPRAAKWAIETRKPGDVEKGADAVKRDPLVLVRWLVRPVLRDLAIISTTRSIERMLIAMLDSEAAGRFIRSTWYLS